MRRVIWLFVAAGILTGCSDVAEQAASSTTQDASEPTTADSPPTSIEGYSSSTSTGLSPTTVQAPLSDLYFAAEFIPEGLKLDQAGIVLAPRRSGDAGVPFAAVRTYIPVNDPNPGEERLGDVWLQIDVFDALTVTDQRYCIDNDGQPRDPAECRAAIPPSACDGTAAIDVGAVNSQACIAEQIENSEPIYSQDANVIFAETDVRGRPALLRTETGSDYSVTTIFVYEGSRIITRVWGQQTDQEAVLRVAEELRPITRTEFEADTR